MTTLEPIEKTTATLDCDTIHESVRKNPMSYSSAKFSDGSQHDLSDLISYLGDLISKLNSDIGALFSLHLDLLKAELRDSAKTIARDSALLIIGAIFGWFAFGVATLALIGFISFALPLEGFMAFAVGSVIVAALYLVLGGILAYAGIRHLKKKGLTPQRSIAEAKRDKDWVKELRT